VACFLKKAPNPPCIGVAGGKRHANKCPKGVEGGEECVKSAKRKDGEKAGSRVQHVTNGRRHGKKAFHGAGKNESSVRGANKKQTGDPEGKHSRCHRKYLLRSETRGAKDVEGKSVLQS